MSKKHLDTKMPQSMAVGRSESIFTSNIRNRFLESGYTLSYTVDLRGYSLPLFTVTDYTRPGLDLKWSTADRVPDKPNFSSVEKTPENVHAGYDPTSGEVTIEIRNTDGKAYGATLGFSIPHTHKFIPDHEPRTSCNPTSLNYGDETELEVVISPFKIKDTRNLYRVDVGVAMTVLAEEVKYLGSTPPTRCAPPRYGAQWIYESPMAGFKHHTTRYYVRVTKERRKKGGSVIFRTLVFLWYNKPVYATEKPTFKGGSDHVAFTHWNSRYGYGYQHTLENQTT